MTATAAATKPPREEDPRHPLHRLGALLDDGSVQPITALDDSGVLAVTGTVSGAPVVAFCSDPTIMGGAMGEVGCKAVVAAYAEAMRQQVPIIGLWHSGGARLAEGCSHCTPSARSSTR